MSFVEASQRSSETLTVSEAEKIAAREIYAISPKLWLATYHHVSARRQMMTFDDRFWQLSMLKDNSPEIVCQKCSQAGVTELLGLLEMFSQAMLGKVGGYILPTDRIVFDFTPRRIDRVIQEVPFYRAHCGISKKSSDTKSQKTLFGCDWNIVGSNVVTNLYEKPWDGYIVDEYDKCVQQNLVFAKDRITSASNPFVRKFGNPSIGSCGIAQEYEASDKKSYLLKCEHCNEWQPLSWFDNVVTQSGEHRYEPYVRDDRGIVSVVCRTCRKPIDRLQRGEWVAEHPDRRISGYQVSQLFGDARRTVNNTDTITLKFEEFMAGLSNPTELQRFYNNVLGVPFSADGAGMTEELLAKCASDYVMPQADERTYAGVDVGSLLHVSVCKLLKLDDGRMVRRKIYIGALKDFEELHWIATKFGIQRGVIDAMPETRMAREFCRKHPGWYICYYDKSDTAKSFYDIKSDTRTISTNRTQILDASYAEYVDRQVQLPDNWRHIDRGEFVKQLCASVRVFNEDKQRFEWVEGNAADHYRHADTYELLACMVSGYGRMIGQGVRA